MKNFLFNKFIYIIIITCNICYANEILNNKYLNYNYAVNIIIIIIFILCYIFIIFEEKIKIKKSTISILFSSVIWIILALAFKEPNENYIINEKFKNILTEYCELFLFLFTTMIYVNLITELGFTKIIKNKILLKNMTYKKLYWVLTLFAFFISPIADNLTTVLIIYSILITIEKENVNFINLTSISIIIASNAGGVFSPFGDITTLMIWQKNLIETKSFIYTFIPSLINFIVPAFIISLNIESKNIILKNISLIEFNSLNFISIGLFIFTIILTVIIQMFLNIPSTIGMMLGLTFIYLLEYINNKINKKKINILNQIKKIDWDTLLFFYGIMLCIGGLSIIGSLDNIANIIYDYKENIYLIEKYTAANIIIGLISAFIDNIPITFAVLEMNIKMNEYQWLLLTLTTGTGGSLLSIGSSAGIVLMGYSKGKYTFFSHLKWSWAILIGYILSILTYINLNK